MPDKITPSSRLALLENQISPSPLSKINHPLLKQHDIELWIKRDDLLHPVISGNKWRKLKYILKHALTLKMVTLISMGGAYSNHLHALAYAGKIVGLPTIGMIRGEQPKHDTATLADVRAWGMQLNFVSRSEYRTLRTYRHRSTLPGLKSGQYWLPEGGSLKQALQGVEEMVVEINHHNDYLCVPCGTGTTLAGMINAVSDRCTVLGFAALKGADFLYNDVELLLTETASDRLKSIKCDWSIMLDYHFGGFARANRQLFTFMKDFTRQTGLSLDAVYTGKMMFGIFDLIAQGYFPAGKRIIAVHTGGLQGNRGFLS